ncbi:Protein sds23 [Rhizopus stolonifer]|uniref:Protein sds23 n=1 Tax=Rhizopus stolonifer TaxID=4846 RepID=A0A367JZH1_RHIST|nr:Protein sds23 [Rhizopus stolonifer]
MNKTLRQLGLGVSDVIAINADSPVLDALSLMSKHGISSVAVLGHMDIILGNISMTDIKFVMKSYRHQILWKTCFQFVSIVRTQQGVEDGQDRIPVFDVRLDTTLGFAVAKLLATKSHRVWVVDEREKAIGVVSLTDVMRVIATSNDRFTINEIGQAVYVNDLHTRADKIPNKNNIRANINNYDTQPDISSVCDSPLSSAAASFSSNFFPVETSIKDHLGADKKTLAEAEPLIEKYFEHVHKYIPMIHKPSFLKQMQSTTNPPSRLLLFTMCAVASRWSLEHGGYNVDKLIPPGYTYYQKALGLLDDFFDIPRVSTIQALVLLVKYQEYFQRVGYFHRSHAYLGIAARMCLDLGLSDVDGENIEAEIGKRTFWATFIYDLLMSIEQGRATYFDASKCASGYPSATPDESSALEDAVINQNTFIQLCKILSVIYSVVRRFTIRKQTQGDHRTREQTIEEQSWLFSIHTHLENFYYEISQDPQYSIGEGQIIQDPFVGFLHLTYHFCVILLHQNYVEGSLDTNEYDFIPYTHRKFCCDAASSITIIAESLKRRFPVDAFVLPIRGAQHVIHCLSAATTIHQYESLHSDLAITKDMAHRQRLLTLSLVQILSRHSPSLETLKYFNDPLDSSHSVKKRPTSACYQTSSRSIPGSSRKARPVSMTFLENQTGWPTDVSTNSLYQQMPNRYPQPQRPRSVTWSDLACMELQTRVLSYPPNEQTNDNLPSPTYYPEQQMYNPIPSMSDLFLMDSEENQDTAMEM